MQPGTQQEGDACHNLSEENTIGGCPPGSMCVGTTNGAGGMPTRHEGQCLQGQECLALGEVSLCAAAIGRNCLVHGCPEGKACEVDECRTRCSPFKPDSCPAGAVCGAGSNGQSVCYQACDFTSRPGPKGYESYTVTEDNQSLDCRRTGP